MTLVDLKGHLLARRANYEAEHAEAVRRVVLLEADLVRVRREAATINGALQGTDQALADVEKALQAAETACARPL